MSNTVKAGIEMIRVVEILPVACTSGPQWWHPLNANQNPFNQKNADYTFQQITFEIR